MAWTTPETFTAGQTLTAASMNAISGNTEALQFARVLGYEQRTTTYTATQQVAGITSAADIFTDITFTADGTSAYRVEWYFPYFSLNASAQPRLHLVDGSGNDLGFLNFNEDGTSPISGTYYYTPSSGSVTINMRGTRLSGSPTWGAGAGGAGAYIPAFVIVTGPVDLT